MGLLRPPPAAHALVAPELLIGAAVDVVVRGNASFVSKLFGIQDRFAQLAVLAALNAGVWVLEPLYARARDRVSDLSSTLVNNLAGIATIKAFTAEEREVERVRRVSDDYRVANRNAIRYSSAFVPLIRIAILVGFTCTLLIGGRSVIDGTLEVGIYSVLVFMTQRLLWPLTYLGETLDRLPAGHGVDPSRSRSSGRAAGDGAGNRQPPGAGAGGGMPGGRPLRLRGRS